MNAFFGKSRPDKIAVQSLSDREKGNNFFAEKADHIIGIIGAAPQAHLLTDHVDIFVLCRKMVKVDDDIGGSGTDHKYFLHGRISFLSM